MADSYTYACNLDRGNNPQPAHVRSANRARHVLVQPVESKYMYRDPDTSMLVMWLTGTAVYLRHRHSQMETLWWKYMCTVESSSFAID